MRKQHDQILNADALLSELEAAGLLHLSVRTLQAWRRKRIGPSFVRMGRAVRYRRSDLTHWINANLVAASGEGSPTRERSG